jgi:hypothetical protein
MPEPHYTYEDPDPGAYAREFDRSVWAACRAHRRTVRARTHRRIVHIPNAAPPLAALTVLVLVAKHTKPRTTVTLTLGVVLGAVYAGVNDVRRSVIGHTPWRDRHPAIHRLIPRHPLD